MVVALRTVGMSHESKQQAPATDVPELKRYFNEGRTYKSIISLYDPAILLASALTLAGVRVITTDAALAGSAVGAVQ